MRHLLVCADGTWNTPDQQEDGVPTPTNVVRFYNAAADADADGNPQLKYYHPGIGSSGGWWDRVAGGGTGIGLSRNVMSGYRWLAGTYQRGDRIYLLGFSRGAYTVRSLAGMVCACGLLDLSGLTDNQLWQRVQRAHNQGYRGGKPREEWAQGFAFHGTGNPPSVRVFFVGVWDTVGALGIPNDMAILNLLDRPEKYSFHDTGLNRKVLNARHAVALDEWRASFAPTLWTTGSGRQTVKQVWFPGAHSDVGGGYPEIGLSDGALKWMIDEVRELGVAFHPGVAAQVSPDARGVLHDSRTGVFKHLRTRPRSAPRLDPANQDHVHASVLDRQGNPPIAQGAYRATRTLDVGESHTVSVYARDPWNDTTLYLEKGATYRLEASGQWLDHKVKAGPGGTKDDKFHFGELAHAVGSVIGSMEGLFKKLSGNEEADLRGSRREESMDWFALVGQVANGTVTGADDLDAGHELVPIGEGLEAFQPRTSGYLYCFANDAWHFYGNNSGSVTLTVTREA